MNRSIPAWITCCTLLLALAGSSTAAGKVTIFFVGAEASPAWKGAEQGIIEANILGRFTGQGYELKRSSASAVPKAAAAVIVAAGGAAASGISDRIDGAVVNVTDGSDSLRKGCRANLFHTIPSDRMRADALAQWRRNSKSQNNHARAWHPDFVKFAARDLNNRYRKTHGEAMDDEAWAAWAAVKTITEAVTRGQATDPVAIARYLREELEFDGQKGAPHSFRDTGQLRQPLLIVEDGKLVAEAPVRGVADPDDLDTLGLAACP